jgi:hypothetical protein
VGGSEGGRGRGREGGRERVRGSRLVQLVLMEKKDP